MLITTFRPQQLYAQVHQLEKYSGAQDQAITRWRVSGNDTVLFFTQRSMILRTRASTSCQMKFSPYWD